MKLEHSFTVPVPPEQAWGVLLDIRTVAPCMPGAAIDTVDGDDFTGTVKVKVGPITVTYRGSASFTEKDESARRATIVAKAKETKGSGTARATVTGTLSPAAEGTRVDVVTDLAITGKPAQFGRGVMADVGGKLIGQFADCLAQELGRTQAVPVLPVAAEDASAETPPVPGPEAMVAPVTTDAVAPEEPAGGDDAATGVDAIDTRAAAPAHVSVASTPTAAAPTSAAPTSAATTAAVPTGATAPSPVIAPRRSPEAIDLLGTAGMPVAKRLAPVLAVVAALIALVALRRRSR